MPTSVTDRRACLEVICLSYVVSWRRMLADLVTGLLRRAGEGLLSRPFTREDQAIVDDALLDPALPVRCIPTWWCETKDSNRWTPLPATVGRRAGGA